MAVKQSIPELTDSQYNELRYNSSGSLIVGSFMPIICDMLGKCGIDVNYTDKYDDTIESAVSEFQQKANLNITGILTTDTWKSMIMYSDTMSDLVSDDDTLIENDISELSVSPHYGTFFDDEKYKTHRRSHKDIVIQFGNQSITKTIKDVFMRSVTVEVDTSGNPIFEIYEFIARDIKESDEISDATKYTSDNEPSSSSDIKYNFNFVKPAIVQTATPSDASGGGGGGDGGESW